ncbi:hypothetical protein [uncultured Oscillibacter sp.]|uniref:hypothetical protein n=1 Tax=uncultured Oscillibacter sp. TaxID=876091 RepID=UPI00260C59A7|nr:hypothetical protein [uncultured Oscillibacter sp.]
MSTFSEQISSNKAALRFDVIGGPKRTAVAEDMSFLNYRLGSVEVSHEITKERADIVWYYDEAVKSIRYVDGQLILTSFWEEGELNKIMVSMLANEMDKVGLHPFHSSSVIYKGHGILLVGGENNHGKSMTQLEGCRRGAEIFSTETTVMDHESGIALYGSKNIYVRKRAKGTERSDLADQDEGVKMFFGDEPEMPMCYEPKQMDLAVMPCIDGWFKTDVKKMGQFEASYQSYHSMMNFFGLNQLLCGKYGLAMPIVDTDARRQDRAAFCAKYAAGRPYYMIRAKSPQLVFDKIDKLMEELGMN